MELEIRKYLVLELKCTDVVAEILARKVTKYEDIRDEFLWWLKHRDYNVERPVMVEGYTAAEIYRLAPKLDGIGIYNFLVDLRDEPERARRMIAEGFVEL